MIPSPSRPKPRFYSGFRALPVRLKILLHSVKYLLHKKKYPLFLLNPAKGGLIQTILTMPKLKLTKIIGFDGSYYLSLITPRWPSKPFDQKAATGGLNIRAAGTPWNAHLDLAILAVTQKCPYQCLHCYEKFNLDDRDSVPIPRWKEVIAQLQDMGTGIIALSGGEPMLRFEGLLDLLEFGDKSRSEFHIYTSGHGITYQKALALKHAGLQAAAVGLDDVSPSPETMLSAGIQEPMRKLSRQCAAFMRRACSPTSTCV